MKPKKFKDACDRCKKMDYCQGYCGEVLCSTCIGKEEENKNGNGKPTSNND